jgi:NAD(P)-dependent dehydrogenase (short-subunit alcohol dehydrogenase family)
MTDTGPPATMSDPLAIICGGGTLPFAVADAARRQGRRVVLVGLRGSADPQAIDQNVLWTRIQLVQSLVHRPPRCLADVDSVDHLYFDDGDRVTDLRMRSKN